MAKGREVGDKDRVLLFQAAISQAGLHLTYLLGPSGGPRLWRALGFEIWTEKLKMSFPQILLLCSFVHAASTY